VLRELLSGLALLLLSLAPAARAGAQAAAPFVVSDLPTRGRVLDVFVVHDAQGKAWLVALSAEGMPPDDKRYVSVFPRGESAASSVVPVSHRVAALDVADIGGAPGPELLLLEATRIQVLDARGAPVRSIPLDPPLPLPPRTREIGRLDFARDWRGDGTLAAILPEVTGLRIVPLSSEAPAASLALPFTALYGDNQPTALLREGFFRMELLWPSLAVADDDGDGVPDLVATTRYALTVFRGVPGGFSARPSRVRRFPPFTFEEERRLGTNVLLASVADLDGDGDADLVVHRTTGMLTGSRAETRIHANAGRGADPLAAPAGVLTVDGGVAGSELHDLDGDGRPELVQIVLPFSLAQLARILVRSQAELELRVYGFAAGQLGTPALRWSGDLALPYDFKSARVTTLFPRFEGDFNGDGRRDLLYGDGDGNAVIRLGLARGAFASAAVRVPLGAKGGQSLTDDLDGDRLDEIVYWDPIVQSGRLRVARNQGKLPGSPPRIAPAPR
jgi:hypothetical protein